MQRFVNDDAGYLRWLREHPNGFVLNTFPHVTRSYLVLHRASCRTINRPLEPGRLWTHQYGKSCSDDRASLETWVLEELGVAVHPCGTCLSGEADRPPVGAPGTSRAAGSGGPRIPRGARSMVAFDGDPVCVVIPGCTQDAPRLVIEGAQWLAEFFFRTDASAVGKDSYDAWIEDTQRDPARRSRIVDGDVAAINRTMRARTEYLAWAPVLEASDWSRLTALQEEWDLFDLSPAAWADAGVSGLLASLFGEIRRPGLGLAVITKVLHIKRPRLIPVLDRLVALQVGGRATDDITTWVDAVERVREVGRANRDALRRVNVHLRTVGLAERTPVRVLDALLWTSNPESSLYASLAGWESVLRPRVDPPCRTPVSGA